MFASLPPEYLAELRDTALHYMRNGISAIPVRGLLQPGNAGKTPVIDWNEYRARLTRADEIRRWYDDLGYGGLAIPLGEQSQRVCLEFDDGQLDEQFRIECPTLVNTYTELSAGRGLPHYFYKPPAGVRLNKRGRRGAVELLGEGQYVVVAPTAIAGDDGTIRHYTNAGGSTLTLTHEQWDELIGFIERVAPIDEPQEIRSHPRQSNPYTFVDWKALAAAGDEIHQSLQSQLVRMMEKHGGRNTGLFITACIARDDGHSEKTTAAALMSMFINLPAPPDHPRETVESRRREGLRTIASAYSRPARPRIANEARTKLLNTEQGAYTLRMLETLYRHFEEGDYIPQSEIVALTLTCTGMSKTNALEAIRQLKEIAIWVSGQGQTLDADMAAAEALPATAPNSGTDFPRDSKAISLNAIDTRNFSTLIPFKRYSTGKRGAPGVAIRLPARDELYYFLRVSNRAGDPIPLYALRSTPRYREAFALARIKRTQKTKNWQEAKASGLTKSGATKMLNRIGAGVVKIDPDLELLTPEDLHLLPVTDKQYSQWKKRGKHLLVNMGIKTYKAAPSTEAAQRAWAAGYSVFIATPKPDDRTAPPEAIGIVSKPSETAQNRASKPTVKRNRAAGTDYQPPAETPLYAAVSLASDEISAALLDDPLLQFATELGGVVTVGHRTAPELVELPTDDEIRRAG